jgi:ACS family glucarate transporter-like MFS transporter
MESIKGLKETMPTIRPTNVRWRVLSILVLASFISYALRYNLSTAAPVMMADLGLTEIQWGWVLAAFLTGYALFQLPGGILGDRLGPRRVLATIAVLWALLTAVTAFVPGTDFASTGVIMASLMLLRFLVGVVHAPVYPATNPVVVNWFPIGGWALPLGLTSTGLNLGVAASAPILAWSIVEFGWRVSFLFLSPLGLILAALWWWYARDHPEQHRAVNAKEIELIQAGRTSGLQVGDHPEPIHWLRLLKNRDVVWLTVSYFCVQYTFYVVFSWFFYFLVEVRQFSMTDASFVTSAQWMAGGAGAAIGGWVCDRLCRRIGLRWGCRLPLVIGGTVSAICLVGGIFHPSPAVAIGLLVACFFFNQAMEAPYWTISMAIGGKHSGAVGGAMNTGGNTIGIFNALLVPWAALTFGWTFAISSAAIFSLIAAWLILLVRPDQQIAQ